MDARPTNRMPTFNQRKLKCAVIGSLCYVGSVVCFYVHAKRKNLGWKLIVAIAIRDFVHVNAEIAIACNLIGPLVVFWDLPLFHGEYSNETLFAMLLGSVCLATTLMFIAPINTDFGLLVLLCGSTVKLEWENDKDDQLIWLRTASACTVIILVRYLVDNEARNGIANKVRVPAV
ncbi:hypothetical protein KY290_025806 [Solanum tuberosum]|uniref:Uncharacterized protein n=1 Tax=Solanum tuberosum TaxID=4113 RepID=A0ABQ7UUL7_SOLTU|nr:hypothetical protein KY289_024877 [Solanum tuberosum]KAH0755536.1 hypothetical protein KY290_025806 [Solanum tuberosum]